MKVIYLAAAISLAWASRHHCSLHNFATKAPMPSGEYHLEGSISPYTVDGTYFMSYYVDEEFIFGAKGQKYFMCCNYHDKDRLRKDMARATELAKNEANWVAMSGGGAKVVLQEETNKTGCTPMPCRTIYGTLRCDSKDEAACAQQKAKMLQTVEDASRKDVSTDDSGFNPQFLVNGEHSFSFNFNGDNIMFFPCSDEKKTFSSATEAIAALQKAAAENSISAVPGPAPSVGMFQFPTYMRYLANGQCVGYSNTMGNFKGYQVPKILVRYAERAPVVGA